MVARKRAPSWPLVARWSPDRVTVTTGRTSTPAVDDPRPLDDPADADHGHLGRVDHAVDLLDTRVTQVGDGDARIGHLGRLEPAVSGPVGEVAQPAHQLLGVEVRPHRG